MKKYIKYMAATLLAVNFTACSGFLDKEVDLTLGAEDVFDKAENTRGLLANIYTYLPDAFVGYTDGQYRGASRDCMTDNAISFGMCIIIIVYYVIHMTQLTINLLIIFGHAISKLFVQPITF